MLGHHHSLLGRGFQTVGKQLSKPPILSPAALPLAEAKLGNSRASSATLPAASRRTGLLNLACSRSTEHKQDVSGSPEALTAFCRALTRHKGGALARTLQLVWGARASRPWFSASGRKHFAASRENRLVRRSSAKNSRRDADWSDRDGRAPQFLLTRSAWKKGR